MRLKTKIKYLYMLPLLLMASAAIAQIYIPKNIISINIIALFGPSHPNLELSFEHRFNDRFSLEFGINPIILSGNSNIIKPKITDKKGLILKLEPKFSIKNTVNQDTFTQTFISFEIYHVWSSYKGSRYKINEIGKELYSYNIKSKTLGLIPQIGYRRFSDNFMAEFSGGYGRRLINIENNYNSDFTKLSSSTLNAYAPEQTGNHNWYLISMNTKFGVTF